jgi:hypothetical protein
MHPSGQKTTQTAHLTHCLWFHSGRSDLHCPVLVLTAQPGSRMSAPMGICVHPGSFAELLMVFLCM